MRVRSGGAFTLSRKANFFFALFAVLVCIAAWLLQALPSYDIKRVEPRLLALETPYQSVTTSFFWDGGSMGIEIVDRNGKHEMFAIPSHLGEPEHYTKVFVGAIYDRRPNAVEVSDPEDTKRML